MTSALHIRPRGSTRPSRDDRRQPTPFQRAVYAVVRRVPRGKVTTYRAVAAAAGCGSARAVGQALRRNPFAPSVPCHRVIASDLSVGGFRGRGAGDAVRRKESLLKEEGVLFRNGRLADRARLIRFQQAERGGA